MSSGQFSIKKENVKERPKRRDHNVECGSQYRFHNEIGTKRPRRSLAILETLLTKKKERSDRGVLLSTFILD